MKILVNGNQRHLDAAVTVAQLLTLEQVKMPQMVTVELNGKILRPNQYEQTILGEGDQVEFIYFMGGGL